MKHIFGLFIIAFLINGCVKNNPDPTWLEIGEWTLEENPNSQNPTGVLTSNFSNAWVYVDDQLIGVFEVPCKIPLLLSGESEVKIFPAILNNGISATKKIYPFMYPHIETVNFIQNQTVSISPKTMYYEFCEFWIEDFEDSSIKIEDDVNSSASLIKTDDPSIVQSFNEVHFGRVNLTTSEDYWAAYTNGVLHLPSGEEVYLEIDYHNTNAVVTGVLAVGSSSTEENINIQLNAQDDSSVKWKKIYIDLKEIVSNSPNANYFEISFQASLDEGETSGQINIDNIKLVHF